MRFVRPTSVLLFTACLLDTTNAFGWKLFGKKSYNLLGFSPPAFYANGKRDLDSLPGGFNGLAARDSSPAEKNPLDKRGGKSCECVETETASYALASLEPFMATPFGKCNTQSSTSRVCPTDHFCVPQDKTFSRCLPTTVTLNADYITYTGPAVQPSVTFWWLDPYSLPKYAADPSGQCGGTAQPSPAPLWDKSQTKCPHQHACACQQPGFSICMDTRAKEYTGTACPNTCKYQFKENLPPPTATAKIGGQCGGSCWPGPTNCPGGATCFTETHPSPGAYAMCHTTKPAAVRKLRLKERAEEGINVPARVQALATPIYF
ncbi:hypothetical protein TWF106_008353 [Orbilia oligospora]|uniref:CBM1 domain-containing protein n=1 Tax=Orbilia oligospora TaxID=2813651 RepID=A0A7C8Q107_ORBOL|nr:hypothetical protein TWF788_002699 [Orbilia oligospora]KAF3227949.1 hypothetical protein TWF106_008353 [Orbilia oligospora]